jgi:hypothetical protein
VEGSAQKVEPFFFPILQGGQLFIPGLKIKKFQKVAFHYDPERNNPMPKQFTLPDFLTEDEIWKCQELYKHDRKNFHQRCMEEIIKPNIQRINNALGQENDPGFLAYAVEYVMMQIIK